jgi:hypothetical protein
VTVRVPVAALACGLAVLGCEERGRDAERQAEAPASAASVAEALGIDAAAFETVDPPAPAGDLKADLDRFVNVQTCVSDRAALDPLVADGLRGIGYDTFLRDACRMLEATKDRKREGCDRIDSSALRAKCQSWVAIASQTPDACPLLFEGLPSRGRDATCVAVASKDLRLCASEPRASQRATCEALATRDDKPCEGLLAAERPSCVREIARWKQLLPPPLEGLAKLPAPRGKLVVRGVDGTPDPPHPEADLGPELARGLVVVTSGERARVVLGSLGESEAARIAASPAGRARAGAAVVLSPPPPGAKAPAKTLLEKLEIVLPGEAPLVHPPAPCDCRVSSARVDRTRGGEIAITIEGTVQGGARTYRLSLEAATFARDVVADAPGGRALPPVHPLVKGGSQDTR